jgi:hypothetical protein
MTELNMQQVCEILKSKGIPAYVEQTGGGCATIYAGEPAPDSHGDLRYPACAGPGVFNGPGWTNPSATTDEFYIGPDDDGETDPVSAKDYWDEHWAARELEGWVLLASRSVI